VLEVIFNKAKRDWTWHSCRSCCAAPWY